MFSFRHDSVTLVKSRFKIFSAMFAGCFSWLIAPWLENDYLYDTNRPICNLLCTASENNDLSQFLVHKLYIF